MKIVRFPWQPITSAPLDEQILLAKFVDEQLLWIASGNISKHHNIDNNWYSIWSDIHDDELKFNPISCGFHRPTHWCPMPTVISVTEE